MPDDSITPEELRARLLALVGPLLAGPGALPTFPVYFRASDASGAKACFTFSRDQYARGAATPVAARKPRLRRIHHKLLEKATLEPMATKRLIQLAGYEVNTYSRDAVTFLVRYGYLQRVPEGVCLPRQS